MKSEQILEFIQKYFNKCKEGMYYERKSITTSGIKINKKIGLYCPYLHFNGLLLTGSNKINGAITFYIHIKDIDTIDIE